MLKLALSWPNAKYDLHQKRWFWLFSRHDYTNVGTLRRTMGNARPAVLTLWLPLAKSTCAFSSTPQLPRPCQFEFQAVYGLLVAGRILLSFGTCFNLHVLYLSFSRVAIPRSSGPFIQNASRFSTTLSSCAGSPWEAFQSFSMAWRPGKCAGRIFHCPVHVHSTDYRSSSSYFHSP